MMSQSLLGGTAAPSNHAFDGFEEQFRSMLSDEEDQPTSSDHYTNAAHANDQQELELRNNNEEPKEEVQNQCNNAATTNIFTDRATDPKRVKR